MKQANPCYHTFLTVNLSCENGPILNQDYTVPLTPHSGVTWVTSPLSHQAKTFLT